jgi:hypothetical protein
MAAEIPDGAVLVARAILNSSLWTMRPEDRVVAMTCIALCNYRPSTWWDGKREVEIGRGQFIRSWDGLAKACGLSVKSTRTSVQHLENSHFLARTQAGRYSIFTVPKYDFYQDLGNYSDSAGKTSGKTLGSSRAGCGQDAGNKQEGNKGNKGNEGGEEGGFASASPPMPPDRPEPASEDTAKTGEPFRPPEGFLGDLASALVKKPDYTSGTQEEVIRQLCQKVAAAGCPSRLDTIRRYVESWRRRFGAQAVEAYWMDQANAGKDVVVASNDLERAHKNEGRPF